MVIELIVCQIITLQDLFRYLIEHFELTGHCNRSLLTLVVIFKFDSLLIFKIWDFIQLIVIIIFYPFYRKDYLKNLIIKFLSSLWLFADDMPTNFSMSHFADLACLLWDYWYLVHLLLNRSYSYELIGCVPDWILTGLKIL